MNIKKIRKQFSFLKNNKNLIYFDSAATALKPKSVIKAVKDYYTKYSVNAFRGDYYLAYVVDTLIEQSFTTVADFINANEDEIIFTPGTTHSLNLIAQGFVKDKLNEGDEILISELEHSSNILPWFEIAKEKKAIIKYVQLENNQITLESFKNSLSKNTKFIALSHTSNVLGNTIPLKEICEIAKTKNIYTIIDGAQFVPTNKLNIKDYKCDFYVFSPHKLGAPNGIGVVYAKDELLKQTSPLILGGGMNQNINKDGSYDAYSDYRKFLAGTPNIEGILGLKAAINFINDIGMENIQYYSHNLRNYALDKLKQLHNVEIYNEDIESTTIAFNIKDVFAQDAATLFNKYNIALRSGHHCAKLLNGVIKTEVTLRASFYFYNTYEEVDKFIEIVKKGSDFLDAYF